MRDHRRDKLPSPHPRPIEGGRYYMKVLRFAALIMVVMMATVCLVVPAVAFAKTSNGELASWSPHGDAADGTTRLSVGCTDSVKRTFYVSNTRTVFVNTNRAAKKVSRNTLFRTMHAWVASDDCPDVHLHWYWMTRLDGTRYRFVSRMEAANRSD
jgi:hypothetical protein